MNLSARIEAAVAEAILIGQRSPGGVEAVPGRLAAALDHATMSGGARIRPTILLSVALACGDDRPLLSDAAAAALLHIIAADRGWNEGAAQARLLKMFEAVGVGDPWSIKTRARLRSILFS